MLLIQGITTQLIKMSKLLTCNNCMTQKYYVE